MVYMGRCRRRIHYHPRHLLDYKQVANTDNAAVLPVCLMEKFTNGLLDEKNKGFLYIKTFTCTFFKWLVCISYWLVMIQLAIQLFQIKDSERSNLLK